MTKSKEVPKYIVKLGWLISFFAFIIGFWHTHKGLIPFNLLDGYGSYVFAALVLMVMVVAYERAISGVKLAIFFYLVCAFFNFTFNLNSIYPSMLGRKLMNEETTFLNTTLQNNSAKVDSIFNNDPNAKATEAVGTLKQIQTDLINQLLLQGGPGPESRKALENFNSIAGASIGNFNNLYTKQDYEEWVNRWRPEMTNAITNYVLNNFSANDLKKKTIAENKLKLMDLKTIYNPKLEKIIRDKSDLNIDFKKIQRNPQIGILSDLVYALDNISNSTNKAANKIILKPLNGDVNAQSKYPKIQNLGKFEHTYESVFNRLNRIDTWGVIFLVAFIDFIVPLAVYFMIRKKDEEDTSAIRFKPTGFNN